LKNGLIVEGVSGIGKSVLLERLQTELVNSYPAGSKMLLSEHLTERVFENARASGHFELTDALGHCARIADLVEALVALRTSSKFGQSVGNGSFPILVERWVGSHVAHAATPDARVSCSSLNPESSTLAAAASLVRRMIDHGFEILVLSARAEDIERSLSDTLRRRSPHWVEFVDSMGGERKYAAHLWRWQQSLTTFYDSCGIKPVQSGILVPSAAEALGAGLAKRLVAHTDDQPLAAQMATA